jgi:hypothetical protein
MSYTYANPLHYRPNAQFSQGEENHRLTPVTNLQRFIGMSFACVTSGLML